MKSASLNDLMINPPCEKLGTRNLPCPAQLSQAVIHSLFLHLDIDYVNSLLTLSPDAVGYSRLMQPHTAGSSHLARTRGSFKKNIYVRVIGLISGKAEQRQRPRIGPDVDGLEALQTKCTISYVTVLPAHPGVYYSHLHCG